MRLIALLLIGAMSVPALALTPYPKPEPNASIEPGKSAPFAGSWSVSVPTMEVGEPDTDYAICQLPVRLQAADDTHIFYLGPRDIEGDAALELIPTDGGTRWEPIAGGPMFFAVWIDADVFYLYDQMPENDADWGMPFVYRRCPQP